MNKVELEYLLNQSCKRIYIGILEFEKMQNEDYRKYSDDSVSITSFLSLKSIVTEFLVGNSIIESEEKKYVLSFYFSKVKEYLVIIDNIKEAQDSWLAFYSKDEFKVMFVLLLNWIEEEIQNISKEKNSIETNEITGKNGYSKKEVFVLLREIGLFESKTFLNLPPNKRNFALSILLNSDIDYAKQLYNLNSIKYNEEGQNGIKEKSVNKVKYDLEKQK